ncbi:hypothetical protein CEXT_420101 [Caerostris extrusa]|uniref:Uncharacterized protein n=1 Tax=Caerostris extrusa TaxID=172846 RepID=A0AAV4XR80_CAEEX|nr:hypothetical protein CEXT_420101 [Caerostris extrusa]
MIKLLSNYKEVGLSSTYCVGRPVSLNVFKSLGGALLYINAREVSREVIDDCDDHLPEFTIKEYENIVNLLDIQPALRISTPLNLSELFGGKL